MANLNIRIDDELKTDAEHVLAAMGLTMSAAVNLFLTQMVRTNSIPFEIKADPFYSKSNLNHLEKIAERVNTGTANYVEHELIEVD